MEEKCFYKFCLATLICFFAAERAQSATTITIGALVSSDTIIGKIAKQAIDVAVASINQNTTVLNGYNLDVKTLNTNCRPFEGAVDAAQLLEENVVAVIGPQSSAVSQFVAHMASSTQVPLLSFAATDPSFSDYPYPFFFRIAHSDAVQMNAIASLIKAYGWKQAIAIFSDDDFGNDGAGVLADALKTSGVSLVHNAAIPLDINSSGMDTLLTNLSAQQARIFVVHMPQNLSLFLFSHAKQLEMMTPDYVWIVSDSTMGTLGSTAVDPDVFRALQGVVGLRGFYTQNTPAFLNFISEWNNRTGADNSVGLHIYGLYAYDATWMLAYALDRFIAEQGFNFTFDHTVLQTPVSTELTQLKTMILPSLASSELAQLKVLAQGPLLRTHIIKTQFQGASGYIRIDNRGDLLRSSFEFVNVVGTQLRVVGYWSNQTKFSVTPPIYSGVSSSSQTSPFNITWPGNVTAVPRGWVIPKNGKSLRILVPKKYGYPQFVTWPSVPSGDYTGYCIEVFLACLKVLPYSVPYTFALYGNQSTPVYDDMIQNVYDKTYDAVVGDVTITTKRMALVDFTQPFIESGLVVVVPHLIKHKSAWAFLQPFTPTMWFITLAFFVFTGLVVWLLEHKKNREFRGHPSKQVVTMLWFIFSTMVFAQREATRSSFGRLVVVIWLFVVLIITSSYTANLTSILTSQQQSSSITGITSLQGSTVAVGYNKGSYVKNYLINLNIAEGRLKPFSSLDAYSAALTSGPDAGGIGAMVVEAPYAQVFLAKYCQFTVVGNQFTNGGWGFVFPKDSPLAVDMSSAIVTLSENGNLQKIHDRWLGTNNCKSQYNPNTSNQLNLDSFWGLFLITGTASALSVTIYLIRLLWQFTHRKDSTFEDYGDRRSLSSRSQSFLRSFASYINEYGLRDEYADENDGNSESRESSNRANGPARTLSIRSEKFVKRMTQYISDATLQDPANNVSHDNRKKTSSTKCFGKGSQKPDPENSESGAHDHRKKGVSINCFGKNSHKPQIDSAQTPAAVGITANATLALDNTVTHQSQLGSHQTSTKPEEITTSSTESRPDEMVAATYNTSQPDTKPLVTASTNQSAQQSTETTIYTAKRGQGPPMISTEPNQTPTMTTNEPNQQITNQSEANQSSPLFTTEPNQTSTPITTEPSRQITAESEANLSPPLFTTLPNQRPSLITTEPNQTSTLITTEPSQQITTESEANQSPPLFTTESNQRHSLITTEPNQNSTLITTESEANQSPPLFTTEPNQRPSLITTEPNQNSTLITTEPNQQITTESNQSLPQVTIESEQNQNPQRITTESNQSPPEITNR